MYTRKDYSIIALAESLKRGGDQRKARFERSLSGMKAATRPQTILEKGGAIVVDLKTTSGIPILTYRREEDAGNAHPALAYRRVSCAK